MIRQAAGPASFLAGLILCETPAGPSGAGVAGVQAGRWRGCLICPPTPAASCLPFAPGDGQRLPCGDGSGTRPRLRVVRNAREQATQLHGGRELATMIEGGTDCGGFSFADNEHAGRMGTRTVGGKRPVVAGRACASALASLWPWRSRWMNCPPVVYRSKPERARCTGWHDPCRDTGARRFHVLKTPVSFLGLSSSRRITGFPGG